MDNIPLEAVLFDKEVVYHPTREGEIFEAIFHKDKGILKETRRPYREFTSATAFVHGHVTTKHNGRLACRVFRDGTEYRLQELYDNIRSDTISKEEAKVVTQSKTKEAEMPPPKKTQLQPMKGLLPVKHPESIIARFKESDKPPIELTSVTILKVIEYVWHGSKYWLDETNMNLYSMDKESGIGDLVGRLNEKGQLTLASAKE